MKRMLSLLLLTVVTVCLTGFSGQAQSAAFSGTWYFSAPDSPDPGYAAGSITFSKLEGKKVAAFSFNNGEKLTATTIDINKDTATFTLQIQGEPVKFKLVADQEKLKGTAILSTTEIIPFTAKRK
ncbi:hypothetical protein [Flavihumibacter sp. CACIAM 22H1]|uniref:hypothetical protein n=1 Tax=Flavihumibacter sp. CACIAM 22H1 TaxID=1812911 RepID=UPI0007A8206B|nr:hypothetical protein [Flavihumibacter sp. CACIAM 22H1]KYP15262.1 MAG: hypothetical protein A1D16_15255 [Flavihumibacter sp. CACIAM 22H1]